jgi:hypothetical protein
MDSEQVVFFFFRELIGNKRPKKKIKDGQIRDWKNRETNSYWVEFTNAQVAQLPCMLEPSKQGNSFRVSTVVELHVVSLVGSTAQLPLAPTFGSNLQK